MISGNHSLEQYPRAVGLLGREAGQTGVSVSLRLLIVWLLLVAAGTLAPFDFGAIRAGHEHSFKLFQYSAYERDPMDFVLNVLLFMPLGALVHREMRDRPHRLRSLMLLTGVAALGISAGLEYFQWFLPSRDSSLVDVAANTFGALIGVLGARSWGASLEAHLRDLRARTSPAALTGALAAVLALMLLISGALQARTRLSTWSSEYPLLVGNERTGDRPWQGRVFALTITDAATPLSSVRRFAAGEPVGLRGAPMAAFDFTGSAPYRDTSGHLPALAWTEAPPQSAKSVTTLTGRPWLQTEGTASRLANQLRDTNAFSLRIQCATDNTNQNGPARIVSNSASPVARNFTLGQQGADLVIRLRTPETGLNGYPLETIARGVFSSNRARDILVTYDGATLLTAVAHDNRLQRTELTPGTALTPVIAYLMSENIGTDELTTAKFAFLALFFLPPGLLIGLLGRARRERVLFFAVYLTVAAVLLEATLVLASGRGFDWTGVAVTAGVGTAVLSVVGVILSYPDLRRNRAQARWLPAQTWS